MATIFSLNVMDQEEILRKYSPPLTPELAGESYLGSLPVPYPTNPQARLDLHGFFVAEALLEAESFLRKCRRKKLLKVRIITGHGKDSPQGFSILFLEIKDLLRREQERNFLFSIEEGTGFFDILFPQ